MADISFIIERYNKDAKILFTSEVVPILSDGSIGSERVVEGMVLSPFLEQGIGPFCLFRVIVGGEEKVLRVKPDGDWDVNLLNQSDLYFISAWDKAYNKLTVSYIPSCLVEEKHSLEVLLKMDYLVKREEREQRKVKPGQRKKSEVDSICSRLYENLVFDYFGKKRIFVRRSARGEEMTLYGKNGRALVIDFENGKYFAKKDKSTGFPEDYEQFYHNTQCLSFDSVKFCDESDASPAFQEVLSQVHSGKALLALWNSYSEIEQEQAVQLQKKIGEIPYTIILADDGFTRVEYTPSSSQQTAIKENREELAMSSMEVVDFKMTDDGMRKVPSFKIKKLNNLRNQIDFYDDEHLIPDKGSLRISTLGDDMVKMRRDTAFKTLTECAALSIRQKHLMQSVLLAIEGKASEMRPQEVGKMNTIKTTLTANTYSFLKERFGIEKLTINQEIAVKVALNTPDIAIIQGPPGTGKSTVIAAICNRLIEEASKDKRVSLEKIILVSAFQNDTVEHIASKIDTFGLPTIKAGKDTAGNIRGEEEVMKRMRNNIDSAIHSLSPDKADARISRRLTDIRDILIKDNNSEAAKQRISAAMPEMRAYLTDELWNAWQSISPTIPSDSGENEKIIKAFKRLCTEPISYEDGGFDKISRLLLVAGDLLTEKEKDFLENAPLDDEKPGEEFFTELKSIKDKHLNELYSHENSIAASIDLPLQNWLSDAISFFREVEEKSYEDEETFMISVLQSLREDLDGNSQSIRDAIMNYGQSLAATNQVAGGKEFYKYKEIENIVLEEAARSNPLDLIIPITKATSRIILVGDQKQLPQLIENQIVEKAVESIEDEEEKAIQKKKFEDSLFKILYENLENVEPQRCVLLEEQFRMHPAIGKFISDLYYEGRLKPGMGWETQENRRQHGLSIPWAKGKAAVFCDVPMAMGAEEGKRGKSRHIEARRIYKILDELKNDPEFDNLSVGIITFYANQVDVLFETGRNGGYTIQNSDGDYEIAPEYKETLDHREKLRIGSVDSFQGKEFDIVILSTVRSNSLDREDANVKNVFGFLTLFNRLNVAFSRAQKLLITVGDANMFSDDFARRHVEGLYRFYTQFAKDEKYGNCIR